jgi:hypothetical protein
VTRNDVLGEEGGSSEDGKSERISHRARENTGTERKEN